MTACVTDNGSNFIKAFKEYQQVESEEEEEEEVEEDDGEVAFADLHSLLTGGDDEDAQKSLCLLPSHHRCAAHILNLSATNETGGLLQTQNLGLCIEVQQPNVQHFGPKLADLQLHLSA